MNDLRATQAFRGVPGRRPERGIALLMVVTVLVALVLIAVPFAISMRQGRERTTAELATAQADFEALLLLDAMKHALGSTHPMIEEQRWLAGERALDADASVDSLDEIALGEDFRKRLEESWRSGVEAGAASGDSLLQAHLDSLKARGLGLMNDDRGSIWTGVVEDANGKVNPNGASPYLLGNLLGSALLAEDLDASSPDITVEHEVGQKIPSLPSFPPKGGWIRVGSEVIRYSTYDGTTFRGCERGALGETPLLDNGTPQDHEQGEAVIDYTAYKMATHLIAARPGFLTLFHNLEDLRSVSGWGAGGILTSARLDRIRSFLSPWSRRETASGWLASQVVVNPLPGSADGSTPDEIEVKDLQNPVGTTAYMNPGTILRITDGVRTTYQTVDHLGDAEGRQTRRVATLSGRVDAGHEDETGFAFEGGRTMAASYAPHPININTAPIEVIYACLVNLHLRIAKEPEQIVTPERAWEIAQMIVDGRSRPLTLDTESNARETGPFRHIEDYGRFLETLAESEMLTEAQHAALYYNAVNPHDGELAFGTAPWCFRTLDVYHLEARVAVSSRGGELAATAIRREVVEIGSDGATAWTLDSQWDFEQRLSLGSGAKWIASGPRGVNYRSSARGSRWVSAVQPALRAPQGVFWEAYPSATRSDEADERGDVGLEPARIELPGVVVHFDSTLATEGWRTDFTGAYRRPVLGSLRGRGEAYPRPFTIDFWWRSYSDANWTAFDCGMDRFVNRYAIFVTDGEEGQELVFRSCGPTLEDRAVEIFVPLERINYQPGTWYHIQASCRGEDPSLVELLIDGVSIGDRRALTWLSGGVGEEDAELQVESTDGFTPYGAVLIGDEVVEYETLSGDAFRDCFRGARGTQTFTANDATAYEGGQGRTWPAGTPVRQLGYSALILQDVMQGGSSLAATLGRWSAVRILETNSDVPDVPGPENANSADRLTFYTGVPPEISAFTATVEPLWEEDARSGEGVVADAFSTSGIALMGCFGEEEQDGQIGDAWTLGGWEFVRYTRIDGSPDQIEITERGLDRGYYDSTDAYFLAHSRRIETANGTDVTIEYQWLHTYLVPISIPGTQSAQGDDYLDPSDQTGLEGGLLRQHWMDWDEDDRELDDQDWPEEGNNGGYLVLGLPTDDGTEPPEVIRYESIDRQGSEQLFVSDGRLVRPLVAYFFRQDPQGYAQFVSAADSEGQTDDGGGITESIPEDVAPPVETMPPEEEPPFDASGGGDDEMVTDGDVFIDDLVPAVTDRWYRSSEAPPAPAAQQNATGTELDLATKPWPAWSTVLGQVNLLFRGALRTNDRYHGDVTQGDRRSILSPCFRVHEGPAYQGPATDEELPGRPRIAQGGRPIGRNDRITLTDGAEEGPRRYEMLVRWADPYSRWAALDSFPEARIRAAEDVGTEPDNHTDEHRGRPRILKFPCGELADELPVEMEFARSTISGSGVVTAFLDELHIVPLTLGTEPMAYLIDEEGISEEATEMRILLVGDLQNKADAWAFHEECGLLDLDGELIVWRDASFESANVLFLDRCERGVLGTVPRPHAQGGFGRLVPAVPVTHVVGSVTHDAASVPVARFDERRWPREGLVRVLGGGSAELIHFSRRSETELVLPTIMDADERERDRGLLRGRFGTEPLEHEEGALVFWQPFRYWDRYLPRRTEDGAPFSGVYDHPEASFVEIGKRVRAGYWHRVGWTEGRYEAMSGDRGRGGEQGGFHDLVVLARFSPAVPWDSRNVVDLRHAPAFGSSTPVAQDRGADRVFVLDDPEGANRIGLEAETAEFRIFFVYRPGAYLPQDALTTQGGGLGEFVWENSWKESPRLRSFTVEYTSRTSTLNPSVDD